jgi:hypothetical protein
MITFLIFNRELILTGSQLKTIAMLYLFSFLWNIAGMRFSVSRWFPTISLAIYSLVDHHTGGETIPIRSRDRGTDRSDKHSPADTAR